MHVNDTAAAPPPSYNGYMTINILCMRSPFPRSNRVPSNQLAIPAV